MNRVLALMPVLLVLCAGAAQAQMRPVDVGGDPARAVAGRDLPETDARVLAAREQLKRVAEATGESEEQVAASSLKMVRFILDGLRVRVLPGEVLEGMAVQAVPGKALSDLTTAYFTALRSTPNKTHAEAMAALKK